MLETGDRNDRSRGALARTPDRRSCSRALREILFTVEGLEVPSGGRDLGAHRDIVVGIDGEHCCFSAAGRAMPHSSLRSGETLSQIWADVARAVFGWEKTER